VTRGREHDHSDTDRVPLWLWLVVAIPVGVGLISLLWSIVGEMFGSKVWLEPGLRAVSIAVVFLFPCAFLVFVAHLLRPRLREPSWRQLVSHRLPLLARGEPPTRTEWGRIPGENLEASSPAVDSVENSSRIFGEVPPLFASTSEPSEPARSSVPTDTEDVESSAQGSVETPVRITDEVQPRRRQHQGPMARRRAGRFGRFVASWLLRCMRIALGIDPALRPVRGEGALANRWLRPLFLGGLIGGMVGYWLAGLWPTEVLAYAIAQIPIDQIARVNPEAMRYTVGTYTGAILGAGIWLTVTRARLPDSREARERAARSARIRHGGRPVGGRSPSPAQDLWDEEIDGPCWVRPRTGAG
jgi:hypothetical protein